MTDGRRPRWKRKEKGKDNRQILTVLDAVHTHARTRHNHSPRHNHSLVLSLRSLHPSIWRQHFFNYDAWRPLFKLSKFGFSRWWALSRHGVKVRTRPGIDKATNPAAQDPSTFTFSVDAWTHLRVTQVASSGGHKHTIVIFLFIVYLDVITVYSQTINLRFAHLLVPAKMSIIYSEMLWTVIH